MPQIEALYVVEFGDVAIGGETYTYWNGGVAVLETNRIFGGDSGYYYLGNYTIKDSQFEATVKIVKHNPTWEDAFGSTSPSFNVKVQATANNGIIEGFVDRLDPPQARLPIRLTRKEDLPLPRVLKALAATWVNSHNAQTTPPDADAAQRAGHLTTPQSRA